MKDTAFLLLALWSLSQPCLSADSPSSLKIQEGDSYFKRRADGHVGPVAVREPVLKAIDAYRAAVNLDPGSLDARFKLMRSLLFVEHYTNADSRSQHQWLDEAITVSKEGIRHLQQRCPSNAETNPSCLRAFPGSAKLYYYSGSILAEWSRLNGALAAARNGAAERIRDDAHMVNIIDDHVRYGGGYRMLGRLHHKCPHIPLVTGWVSKKEVLPNLEKALEIDPSRKYNRFFLAEALYDLEKSRRPEAIETLKTLIGDKPDSDMIVEDLNLQAEAQKDLGEWVKR